MNYFVQFSGNGLRIQVESEETLLAAGLRQGLALPYGCQSGRCGSCRARLLSGNVESPPSAEAGLSAAERAAGYVLLCQARAQSDIELQMHQPAGGEGRRPRTITARVAGKRALADDVMELSLQLPNGIPFEYLPGQYVDFLLDDGRRRSFSIATAAAVNGQLKFHLRVTPGGTFAGFVRDRLPPKSLLRFEGPLGAFYRRADLRLPMLLMAGGTGFAPIRAIIESALESPEQPPMHLYWGARTKADLYQNDLALNWAERHPDFRYTPVLSEPDSKWTGERGLVHETLLRENRRLDGHAVYLAGPPAMVHAGRKEFLAAELDPDHLFYDSFDYAFETWPALG